MIICPNVAELIKRLQGRGVDVAIKDAGGKKHCRAIVSFGGVTVEALVATTPSDIRGVKNWHAALRRAFAGHGVELPSIYDRKKIVDVINDDPDAVMLSGFIVANDALYRVKGDSLEEVESYQLDVGLFNEFHQERDTSLPLGQAFYDHFNLADMRDQDVVGTIPKARTDVRAAQLIALIFNIE